MEGQEESLYSKTLRGYSEKLHPRHRVFAIKVIFSVGSPDLHDRSLLEDVYLKYQAAMGFEGTNNHLNNIECVPVHCNQLIGGKVFGLNVLNQGSFGMSSQFQQLPSEEFQLVHRNVGVGSHRIPFF